MQFQFVHGGSTHDTRVAENIFRIRHDVFKERLNWQVVSEGGRERDRFDDLAPLYLYGRDPATGAEGCFRLLPTTGPNMLRDVFPQLLDGVAVEPWGQDVWEISRFAVTADRADDHGLASVNRLTRWMLVQLLVLCLERGVNRVVAVTDTRFERILQRAGLPTSRFAAPQDVGGVTTVAGWADMTGDALARVIAALHQPFARPAPLPAFEKEAA